MSQALRFPPACPRGVRQKHTICPCSWLRTRLWWFGVAGTPNEWIRVLKSYHILLMKRKQKHQSASPLLRALGCFRHWTINTRLLLSFKALLNDWNHLIHFSLTNGTAFPFLLGKPLWQALFIPSLSSLHPGLAGSYPLRPWWNTFLTSTTGSQHPEALSGKVVII